MKSWYFLCVLACVILAGLTQNFTGSGYESGSGSGYESGSGSGYESGSGSGYESGSGSGYESGSGSGYKSGSGNYQHDGVEPCGADACYNGGYCVNNNTCVCTSGFTGHDCLTYNDTAEMCSNGVCHYGSKCPPGYNCSEHISCYFGCQNNGSCFNGMCFCPPGYGGYSCELEGEVCGNGSCFNGGSCFNETCHCPAMFTGEHCQYEFCNVHCFNNGTCAGGFCHCPPGFEGRYCEQEMRLCGYSYCHSGESCVDGMCVCEAEYWGGSCEQAHCYNCPSYGSCQDGKCVCPTGYDNGTTCDEYVTICPGGFPCYHNGQCGNSSCTCPHDYTGLYCEMKQCTPPCLNGGLCYNDKCWCDYGFSGAQCERPPGEPCGEHYCYHGTACINSTSCSCPPGLVGPSCRERTCAQECMLNGGNCSANGVCHCPNGRAGRHCELELVPCGPYLSCANNGTCVSEGHCACAPGFTGAGCSAAMCDFPCLNGGNCINGQCQCPDGFGGMYCEDLVGHQCGHHYCLNNGVCVKGSCTCPPGFTGYYCEQEICTPDCAYYGHCHAQTCYCPKLLQSVSGAQCDDYYVDCGNFGCANNGTCGRASCTCPPGFTGLMCEERECVPSCLNGGVCQNGRCHCTIGFSGDRCENAPGEVCGHLFCFHGTTCNTTNGTCICPPELTGPYCNEKTCHPTCQNSGVCRRGFCLCPPGFEGPQCETELEPCGVFYCSNGGECVNDTSCQCAAGYGGETCDLAFCDADCNNNGRCVNGHCNCTPGYGGLNCEQELAKCGDGYCHNGGQCSAEGICVCQDSFIGQFCEQEICPSNCLIPEGCHWGKCYCPSDLGLTTVRGCDEYFNICQDGAFCLNNGTCDGHQCVCPHTYSGLHCEQRDCLVECMNGGQCRNDRCECPSRWKGDQCQIRTTDTLPPPVQRKPADTAPPCPTEVVEAREGSLQGMFEWPETGVGSVSRLQCPCPTNPELTKGVFAIRKCRASGVWSQPDWSACRLSAQSQRLCMVSKRELLSAVRNATANKTRRLGAGDVAMLASAVEALTASDENINDEETRDSLLDVVDDILSADESILEETSETSDTSDKIVRVFDKIAQMTNLTNGRLQIRKRNFLMEVRETRLQSISDEGFTPDFAANSSTKAVLPKSLFRSLNLGATDNIRVSSSVIEKGTLFKGRNASVAVTCAIISLSVVGQEVSNLQEPIVLTFKNEEDLRDGWELSCQFWNESLDEGFGAWSSEGCSVMEETEADIKCACNHLTSFTVVQVQSQVEATSGAQAQTENVAIIAAPTVVAGAVLIGVGVAAVAMIFILQWRMRTRRPVSIHDTETEMMYVNEAANSEM